MHLFVAFHASLRGILRQNFFVALSSKSGGFMVKHGTSRCAQEYGSRVGWGLYESTNVTSDSIAWNVFAHARLTLHSYWARCIRHKIACNMVRGWGGLYTFPASLNL